MFISYVPLVYMSLTLLIVPNLILIECKNYSDLILIILTSILQLTPEPIIGTIRLLKSIFKLINKNNLWIPSRKIEKNIYKNGIWINSFKFVGIYSLLSGLLIYFIYKINIIFSVILSSVIILPFYSGLTGIDNSKNFKIKFIRKKLPRIQIKKRNIELYSISIN